MCKECGCGLTDKKDPGYGKGPKNKKTTTVKKSSAKGKK